MDISVVVLAINREIKVADMISNIIQVFPQKINGEILISNGKSIQTFDISGQALYTKVLNNELKYGQILEECLRKTKGDYVITIDTAYDQILQIIRTLWQNRNSAQVIIASPRKKSQRNNLLEKITSNIFSIPVIDFSSGIRLYQKKILSEIKLTGKESDILLELLIQSRANGWHIQQIPINFRPMNSQDSRSIKINYKMLGNLFRMWQLRNSIDSADYDERAFNSKIPFQRYWQRQRYKIITHMAARFNSILDIGCGSSRILHDLENIVGMDIKANKLRYMKQYGKDLIHGTIFTLPFTSESFDCVICSEVIEHIPFENSIFSEMNRVLQPNGTLIIGTPDYGSLSWPIIEAVYQRVIPNGYADEHITHYTQHSLQNLLEEHGFNLLKIDSILGGEIILHLEKIR